MSGILSAALMAAAGGAGGSALTVTVDPPHASGGGTNGGYVPPVTAIAAGGSGGYAYSWAVIRSDPVYPLTILNPSDASTGFDFGVVGERQSASAAVRVTVTSGAESAFADVEVFYVDRTPPGGIEQ